VCGVPRDCGVIDGSTILRGKRREHCNSRLESPTEHQLYRKFAEAQTSLLLILNKSVYGPMVEPGLRVTG